MPNFAPWYRRDEYALMREIMDDGETLPLSFDEWEKNAESERAVAKREGVSIMPVLVIPPSPVCCTCAVGATAVIHACACTGAPMPLG
jgi:hypothetical protein